MSYIGKTLGDGEELLYRAHFNWTYFTELFLWLGLGLVPGLLFFVLVVSGKLVVPSVFSFPVIVGGCALLAGAIIFFKGWVHVWTTEIGITTIRLIMKTGLFRIDSHEVGIANIEEVWFYQSFWGHLFNYGRITVRGTGMGKIILPPLGEPLVIQQHLDDARLRIRHMDGSPEKLSSDHRDDTQAD
jgi:hypothetical protein